MSEENIETTNEATKETPETQSAPKKESKGKGKLVLIVVLIIVALGLLYKFDILSFGGNGGGDNSAMIDADKVVATVIGTTITRADLDEKIEQVKLSLPVGATDPTEDVSFELQLLEDLIDLELLTSAAMSKDYTVSEDEIDAEITTIVEQFPSEEEFYNQLETVGISEGELRENIEVEMHIRRLLEEETDINNVVVTDEEIAELYKLSVGDAVDVPPLADVSEVIRAQLTNQKSAEIIDVYVQELRANAEIEITL